MGTQLGTNTRHYGIDLLRIVSMFMVCMLHVLGAGGILDAATPQSANYQLAWFFESLTFCAVNCYALISGYVGLNAKHKYASIVNLWLQVAFYSILITLLCAQLHPEWVTQMVWQKAFFPMAMGQYWYFTAYFLLFFAMPVLNGGIQALPKEKLRTLLIVIGIVLTCMPRLFERDIFYTSDGYSFVWLAYLYCVGGYIKMHKPEQTANPFICFLIFLLSTTVSWLFMCLIETTPHAKWSRILISYMSPTMVIAAIALFMCFANMQIKKGKRLIAFFAPLSFSVFLIHTHPLLFGNYLWSAFAFLAAKPWYVLLGGTVLAALGIHLGCSLLDLPRHLLFKFGITKGTAWIENKLTKR